VMPKGVEHAEITLGMIIATPRETL